MPLDSATAPPSSVDLPALVPRPPRWVDQLLGDAQRVTSGTVDVAASLGLALVSACIADAVSLSSDRLRARVTAAYVAIADTLSSLNRHPVRFWNFVPTPGELMGPRLDRYMVFNAGRYDAYARWYETERAFSHRLATASAVGISGTDLTIFCLAHETPGTPIENPRQTSSWKYSARYGPKPPCFARATLVTLDGARRLLIGGTASIVGEDSQHVGNAEAQVEETFANISAVIAEARAAGEPDADEIARLTDVRVYVRRSSDTALIRSMIDERCPALMRLEMCRSQVCRPELLVEVEGVAAV